ncbi:flocculation suppression protein [Colletotrichum higginsianum]|uniref:Flocculation suppression protein n=1 Tax=Colletotrichum higginsianum (strain IMI 349063) TaxID=759273 RepID=H1VWK5_COLHI|nr:flocculation suppression protein [Colletotrichum higginsianum]
MAQSEVAQRPRLLLPCEGRHHHHPLDHIPWLKSSRLLEVSQDATHLPIFVHTAGNRVPRHRSLRALRPGPLRDHGHRRQNASHSRPMSRPTTPPGVPFSNGSGGGADAFGNWSWNSANRDNKNLAIRDSSGPPTRRGSMAHILNPTDTAERDDEDEDPRGDDDRKRKRIQ